MASAKTEALVLRCVDFGESDRVVHLLVPGSGRVTAMAKGARRSVRRFGGSLDLFNLLRVDLERRRSGAMARLDGAVLVDSFPALRREPARFALGCYLLELIGRLAPDGGVEGDMRRLFEFAREALRALTQLEPSARLRTLLELRTLDALGLCPELRHCVRCGRAPDARGAIGFSVADGGPLCSACGMRVEGLLSVSAGTLRALEQSLRFELERLERIALPARMQGEARELIERFQRFHLGVDLRSQPFLERMLESR